MSQTLLKDRLFGAKIVIYNAQQLRVNFPLLYGQRSARKNGHGYVRDGWLKALRRASKDYQRMKRRLEARSLITYSPELGQHGDEVPSDVEDHTPTVSDT